MLMDHDIMMSFAARWVENWNQRDVEVVLDHFADEAGIVSPVARDMV